MIREGFDNDLKYLSSQVLVMMDMVRDILTEVIRTLEEQDVNGAREIFKFDDKIDEKMNQIEEKCIELIALQQPKAKDLRTLFSLIKMVTDLERMGDYCVNIAREVILIGKEPLMKELKDIPKMRDIILNMIDATKISFKELDADLAIEVSRDDEMIDEIYKDIYNEVLLKIHENRENISQGTKLLFIGRYLERIADHLTNVCEKIVYITRGERLELN